MLQEENNSLAAAAARATSGGGGQGELQLEAQLQKLREARLAEDGALRQLQEAELQPLRRQLAALAALLQVNINPSCAIINPSCATQFLSAFLGGQELPWVA